eukprot:NODE_7433_length_767_cov_96.097826_g7191_i0.p1 GENE.NODE_7433_length_767_cov_96.097826_g7191_i0~~NODE_7433_length_767_cov_96.097826_g7191_i0.p1  ORF type:complete len:165 (+),score=34.14 NODE_7433_length_767_cov_96.097826_g7191_i0:104-598(+)
MAAFNEMQVDGDPAGDPLERVPLRKVFLAQINPRSATLLHNASVLTLGDWKFDKVWIQGVVVAVDGPTICLDDATATSLVTTGEALPQRGYTVGDRVLVVGKFDFTNNIINAHKVAALNEHPDAEALWSLEVMDSQLALLHNRNPGGESFPDDKVRRMKQEPKD